MLSYRRKHNITSGVSGPLLPHFSNPICTSLPTLQSMWSISSFSQTWGPRGLVLSVDGLVACRLSCLHSVCFFLGSRSPLGVLYCLCFNININKKIMEVWINSYFQPPSAPVNWYLYKCRFCFCFRRETLSNLHLSYWVSDMGEPTSWLCLCY